MVGKILKEFNHVENSTIKTNENSIEVLNKGESLISSIDTMVTIADKGRNAVGKVKEIIDKLGVQSKETSLSMDQLRERSKQIESIISVINEISEQISILSLNASIEAENAGQHGKGFSVIASEIRLLAENTKNSAKNITELTNKIQEEISNAYKNNEHNFKLSAEGIQTNITTNEEIHKLLSIISNVQLEVKDLLNLIKIQKTSTEDVIDKFKITTNLFNETNSILVNHINDAEVVSGQLLEGVKMIKTFQNEN
jgi:methyl-accepting chemotaxis protein